MIVSKSVFYFDYPPLLILSGKKKFMSWFLINREFEIGVYLIVWTLLNPEIGILLFIALRNFLKTFLKTAIYLIYMRLFSRL